MKEFFRYLMVNQVSPELKDFAHTWLSNPIIELLEDSIYEDHNAILTTLYRTEKYNVELFVTKPNVIVPIHKHPGIESYDKYLFGSGTVLVGDNANNLYKLQVPNRRDIFWLTANTWHSVITEDKAVGFLTFQKWNTTPTHVSHDWIDINGNTAPTDGRKNESININNM